MGLSENKIHIIRFFNLYYFKFNSFFHWFTEESLVFLGFNFMRELGTSPYVEISKIRIKNIRNIFKLIPNIHLCF
jgi:hypothetical protein